MVIHSSENKKGALEFETIMKLLLALIVLLIVIGLVFLLKDKSISILDKIKQIFRTG